MNIKTFAELLNGKQYMGGSFLDKTEKEIAMENGFVVVTGASDDLMEFEGAFEDEGGCYDGGEVFFNKSQGVSYDGSELVPGNCIEALWCKEDGYTWTYKTDIPHECFDVYEDDAKYCRGIVFSINDIL